MTLIDVMWMKLGLFALGAFVYCFWKAFKAEYRPRGRPDRTFGQDQAHQQSE
jgi:hypothetical protein